ncbi:MAG: hypothetical protein GY749_30805 [Desulfobacteraceae bacterium]|nr:hypothetical protein [Desulfobacteraceae bacterium]
MCSGNKNRVPQPSACKIEYLLSNDTDADTDKNNLSVTQEIVKPGHGTLSYNTYKQAFIYTPASSFTGKDTFIYTVSDGMSTGAATVNIFVNTAKDDNVTATEDIPLEIPAHELLSNDTYEYPPADKKNVFPRRTCP